MKLIRKIFKVLGLLLLSAVLLIAAADAAWIYVPQIKAAGKSGDIDAYARSTGDITVPGSPEIIALGPRRSQLLLRRPARRTGEASGRKLLSQLRRCSRRQRDIFHSAQPDDHGQPRRGLQLPYEAHPCLPQGTGRPR